MKTFSPAARAFWFGALAGLAVALAPSCGTPKPCGPATCTGCCQSDGTCAKEPDNAADTHCGLGGESCLDCTSSGQACLNNACTGGTGGGSGACSKDNCAGCCTGSTAQSVCINPPTRGNCGANGGACRSCDTGQVCEGGNCVALGDAGVLGRGCGIDADCASLGASAQCKKLTASKRDEYLNGYCTRDCASSQECGGNGVCVEQDPGFGEVGIFCWLRCATAADCRSPGYDCYQLGGGAKGCWLSPLPSYDAGPPSDKVGDPCREDLECQNPPSDGFCVPPTMTDGGPSQYVDGYCTAPCDDSSHCSTDGGAGCFLVGSGGAQAAVCLRYCDGPQSGQSNCRTGYVCRGVRQPDGGFGPRGVCAPSCNNPGGSCTAPTVCQSSGYCQ